MCYSPELVENYPFLSPDMKNISMSTVILGMYSLFEKEAPYRGLCWQESSWISDRPKFLQVEFDYV